MPNSEGILKFIMLNVNFEYYLYTSMLFLFRVLLLKEPRYSTSYNVCSVKSQISQQINTA